MSAPALTTYTNGISQVSADGLNTFLQCCQYMSQLRGFIGVTGNFVFSAGYYAVNDGGQGIFYWNSTGTGPDDNGVTNVVPNGSTKGCWTRVTGT